MTEREAFGAGIDLMADAIDQMSIVWGSKEGKNETEQLIVKTVAGALNSLARAMMLNNTAMGDDVIWKRWEIFQKEPDHTTMLMAKQLDEALRKAHDLLVVTKNSIDTLIEETKENPDDLP